MKKYLFQLLGLTLTIILIGCSGVGVISSSDPKVKLTDAEHLFEEQGRPLIAERLIREAIGSCESTADQACLGEAYRVYGSFFKSRSVRLWNKYREHGFLDNSATFDSRYEKSVEYFKKSREVFTSLQRFDALTNVNLNLGFAYAIMGDPIQACRAFDESAANNRENLRLNPNVKVVLEKGFSSFEEYLGTQKRLIRCQ